MKKPYDLEADDPWLASGYNPSTLPDSKLQHPYKRGGEDDRMTAHQLTVLWTMLPEWVRICSRKTDKKMVAGWKEKAATAALKHAVFRDGDIPRQKVLKWFANRKSYLDSGKTYQDLPVFDDDGADDELEEDVAADTNGDAKRDDNVISRRGLLRFSTNLNGQLLYQEKNRNDVQQRALELKDKVKGGNNGAAFSKASAELWRELSDTEREQWDQEAAKVNTRDSALLRLPFAVQLLSDKLAKEIEAIAGPAAVSVMYLFRDRETGHVDGSVADSSACGTEVGVMSESLGSDLFATLTEWFESKYPLPKKQNLLFAADDIGLPRFPTVDLDNQTGAQQDSILEEYLRAVWASAFGPITFNRSELAAKPGEFLNLDEWPEVARYVSSTSGSASRAQARLSAFTALMERSNEESTSPFHFLLPDDKIQGMSMKSPQEPPTVLAKDAHHSPPTGPEASADIIMDAPNDIPRTDLANVAMERVNVSQPVSPKRVHVSQPISPKVGPNSPAKKSERGGKSGRQSKTIIRSDDVAMTDSRASTEAAITLVAMAAGSDNSDDRIADDPGEIPRSAENSGQLPEAKKKGQTEKTVITKEGQGKGKAKVKGKGSGPKGPVKRKRSADESVAESSFQATMPASAPPEVPETESRKRPKRTTYAYVDPRELPVPLLDAPIDQSLGRARRMRK